MGGTGAISGWIACILIDPDVGYFRVARVNRTDPGRRGVALGWHGTQAFWGRRDRRRRVQTLITVIRTLTADMTAGRATTVVTEV